MQEVKQRLSRCFVPTDYHIKKALHSTRTQSRKEILTRGTFDIPKMPRVPQVTQVTSNATSNVHRQPIGRPVILQRRQEQKLTYPCIVQLHPVELQRACCVEIIKLRLGRRQTAARGGDGGSSGSGVRKRERGGERGCVKDTYEGVAQKQRGSEAQRARNTVAQHSVNSGCASRTVCRKIKATFLSFWQSAIGTCRRFR